MRFNYSEIYRGMEHNNDAFFLFGNGFKFDRRFSSYSQVIKELICNLFNVNP